MGDDQRFEKWASGILGVVSLVLVLNLARIYAGHRRAVFPARAAAHVTKPLTRNPPPARQAARVSMDSARVEPAFADSARIKQGATNLAPVEPGATAVKPNNKNVRGAAPAVARQSRPREMENATASASGRATLKAQAGRITPDAPLDSARAAAVPTPATMRTEAAPQVAELQPIGYVEKADGSREAVVSKGDRVFVVHEGETFDGHYRVLKISPAAVEMADLEAPVTNGDSTASPTLEANAAAGGPAVAAMARSAPEKASFSEAGSAPAGTAEKAAATLPGTPPTLAKREAAALPTGARQDESNADASVPGAAQAAGLAERDGPPPKAGSASPVTSATLAMHATLAKAASIMTRAPAVTETGDDTPAGYGQRPATRPAPIGESVARGDILSGGAGAFAAGPAPAAESATDHDKMSTSRIPAFSKLVIPVQPLTQLTQNFEPGSKPPESLGYVEWAGRQPEVIVAMGDQVKFVPAQLLATANPRPGSGEDSSWHPPPGNPEHGLAAMREIADRGGGSGNLAIRQEGDAQAVRAFKPYCYVERADGRREAFIAVGDEAYLVFEGQLLAHRYRVLKISPVSVEVADESLQQNHSPPSPAVAAAENNSKSREPPGVARRSMPAALPWDEGAWNAAVLAADAELGEKREALKDPMLLEGMRSEPTLVDAGSSTQGMSAAQPREPARGEGNLPLLDSDLAGPLWKDASGRAELSAVFPEPEPQIAIRLSLSGIGPAGITPLPLNGGRAQVLLGFQPTPMGRSPNSSGNSERLLKQRELGVSFPQATGHREWQSITRAFAGTPSAGSMGSVASLQPSSVSDLHLHFSIGDNGCYFPR
jgi:hypothetical protein